MANAVKVAINGFGRIGRNVMRALIESKRNDIEIVAVNDLCDREVSAFLLQHDTVHGALDAEVKLEGDVMTVNGKKIKMLVERDLAKLPWKDLGVDIVMDCTGLFTDGQKAKAHIASGAKKVLISAPGTNVDATVVYGVNHNVLKASDAIVSNASCTTNCLAPLVKPLHEKIGIVQGLMVTIHSYTNDQVLTDVAHKDIRRARSATQSMIPTKTGAAAAVGLVLPELNGKLDGYAMRVPTINVSVVDLTFTAKRNTTKEEIDQILKAASEKELKGILAFNKEQLVSCDFNHTAYSSIYDATLTKVIDNLVKVSSWYDNEWGFSNRMLDVAVAMMKAK